MKTMNELVAAAGDLSRSAAGSIRLAVVAAQDDEVLCAVEAARRAGIASALLFGDKPELERIATRHDIDLEKYQIVDEADPTAAAMAAVAAVRSGEAAALMKGLLDTAVLLKVVFNKTTGLQAGRLVSHVGLVESPYYPKLLLLTDGAINIDPNLTDKIDIIRNAIDCARAIGRGLPKIALLAAVEKVNTEKMPCTLDAAVLTQMNRRGQITGCLVDGPLALDNAISPEAARVKKIDSPVAGDADILVVPNIESGNILYKALMNLGGAKGAGLVMGAAAPLVLTSRADSAATKLASIALAVLVAQSTKTW